MNATFSAPMVRMPQRRGDASTGGTPSAPARWPSVPSTGCSATYGCGTIARVTCSTSSSPNESRRMRIPWPSWSWRWAKAAITRGSTVGRWMTPIAPATSNGATTTTRAGRPAASARATPMPPRVRARPRLPVGFQREDPSSTVGQCSKARGVATSLSTASTTRGPLACVIQSSGFTVIRCERTPRATALMSSGIT